MTFLLHQLIPSLNRVCLLSIAVASEPVGVAVMGTMKVSTVAGGYLGDNGPATDAAFSFPYSTVQDKKGSYYVTDRDVHRIRRITPTGTITTFAGTGICGYNGDHIKATRSPIWEIFARMKTAISPSAYAHKVRLSERHMGRAVPGI